MDLFLTWLVAPVGVLLAFVGLSMLVERLGDFRLPWPIRPALGMGVAIVLAMFGTATDATAELTIPAIFVLAVIGLLLGTRGADSGDIRWLAAAGGIVFAVYAAPIVLSGQATWAGFIKLDDTATWMLLSDHIFDVGRGTGSLPPSTSQVVINDYLGIASYPVGGFVPAAMMSRIVGEDVAWTMQPSMAVAAGTLALLVFELVRPVVRRPSAQALIAVLGSLSTLLVGYYLWGGVKEIVVSPLLALGPALAVYGVRSAWPRPIWIAFGVQIAAFIAVFGPGGAVWLVPTLLPALVLLFRAIPPPGSWKVAGGAVALAVVLALPSLITPTGIFNPLPKELTESSGLGNLIHPLNPLQVAGIWPSLDFRIDPDLKPAVIVLCIVALILAAGAVVACIRQGEDGIPFAAWVGGSAIGLLPVVYEGGPWIDGKAFATVSPAVLAAAILGIVLIWERTNFKIEATVLAVAFVGVGVWQAVLNYEGVWLAPRAHYTELEKIGDRFAGDGPALSTESAVYGSRHFLRELDDEGATDRRYRPVTLVGGQPSSDDQFVDLDQIQTDQLDPYNTIVVRRAPSESRPPASFGLAYEGKYFEVWQRALGTAPGTLIEHLPLGNSLDAGAIPDCGEVRRLSQKAGPDGKLVAARVSEPALASFETPDRPASWKVVNAGAVIPTHSGTLRTMVTLPTASTYEGWLGGVVFGRAEVSVDGSAVGSATGVLNPAGAYEPLGDRQLSAGRHSVELTYDKGGLRPGSHVESYGLGPLIFDQVSHGDLGTISLGASDYQQLCGQRWDWIEAYP
jgi:hypothetical protein